MESLRIINADVLAGLAQLEPESVRCVVTSPPYWGLRNYDAPGQLGQELIHDCLGWATKAPCGGCYVCRLVEVFRGVRRALAKDGTVWLNLGDRHRPVNHGSRAKARRELQKTGSLQDGHWAADLPGALESVQSKSPGLKYKDLCMLPARVALALQADGWHLRQDNVWAKPNPMRESVKDRTTRAHEFVFLLAKSKRYYYDHAAIKTPPKTSTLQRIQQQSFDEQQGGVKDYARTGQNANRSARKVIANYARKLRGRARPDVGFARRWDQMTKAEQQALGANKLSVWTIPVKGYKGAHFATFPEALVEPCILAGSAPGDLVLDPFGGSGTTAAVALKHGRRAVLIELNLEYCELARQRVAKVAV